MEKDRDSKLIAIIALIVSIASLSIGFAALAKDVDIVFSNTNTSISGDLDMKIYGYDTESDGYNFDSKVVKPALTSISNIEASPLIISEDNSTISGGSVTLNNPGQSVKYRFGIHNNSEYVAYIKSIDFLGYGGTNEFKVCTALSGTEQTLVDEACDDININFSMADGFVKFDDVTVKDWTWNNVGLSRKTITNVEMSITYNADAVVPNGDFKINFGDIKFSFSSISGK